MTDLTSCCFACRIAMYAIHELHWVYNEISSLDRLNLEVRTYKGKYQTLQILHIDPKPLA